MAATRCAKHGGSESYDRANEARIAAAIEGWCDEVWRGYQSTMRCSSEHRRGRMLAMVTVTAHHQAEQ